MAADAANSSSGVTNTLRLASYNIHAGLGRDRRFDAARIAAVIAELRADVVALQEVEHHDVDGQDLLTYLGQVCGMTAVAGPTLLRGSRPYGNALLTSMSLEAVRREDISDPGREPRGVVDADLVCSGRPLRLVATHLGLRSGERRRQVERLLAILERRPAGLTVLAGDFNEWLLWGRPLRRLRHYFDPTPQVRTWPAAWPVFALDRIWVRPASALRHLHAHRSELSRVASDHLPLLAELDLDAIGPTSG